MARGERTDPEHGKVKLADYAETWITERPGLRPRSADNYRWLLTKHIEPHIGGVPVGKLSTPLIRQWRATLIGNGVSVSTAAKAYRFLRAVLMTAAEEDKILPRNPYRIKGAGDEKAEERPVLTVAQVFELAEWVGRRPVGNIRKLLGGGYRLRFARDGVEMLYRIYATASTATTSDGTSGWKISSASAKPRTRLQGFAVSAARRRQSHSAYIPRTPTSSGFRRHMAAQPFNRGSKCLRRSAAIWPGQRKRPQ
jgi:Phage integrase, N-terminal SAM-like domain